MTKNFSGNTKPFVLVLCADDAREKADGLTGQLSERGLALCVENGSRSAKGKAERAFAVIALLSKGFAESEKLQDALFAADEAGTAIIPVRMDEAEQNDAVQRILFARNALATANYGSAEELAARIVNGSVLEHPFITDTQKKARRKVIAVTAAAAVIIAAAAGTFLYGILNNKAQEPAAQDDIFTVNGITSEQLENITGVLILGDRFIYSTPENRVYTDNFASSEPEETQVSLNRFDYANDAPEVEGESYYWYSHEDGSRIETAHFDSLDFLEKLPNLRELNLCCVDAPALPDLSGMKYLDSVSLSDCTVTDISGISGTDIRVFESSRTPVEDYSPLTQCALLDYVQIDPYTITSADFSGFAPPALQSLSIHNGQDIVSIDLSGLFACEELNSVSLSALTLSDVDFLENKQQLNYVYLDSINSLTDITALGTCQNLHTVHLWNLEDLRDASPLGNLKKLKDLEIHCPVNDLDFLKEIPSLFKFTLTFSHDIGDYSGLAAVKSFDRLSCNIEGRDYSVVKEYIKGKNADFAEIANAVKLDFSALPNARTVCFDNIPIESLSRLEPNEKTTGLELRNCQYLRSLEGSENLPNLENVTVENCQHLTDYSQLYGRELSALAIKRMYVLPDFSQISFKRNFSLTVSAPEQTDSLDFLNGISQVSCESLDISGMDGIIDLTPLRQMKGNLLTVSPQLASQAEDLVEEGVFNEYSVDYSEGSWDDIYVDILSFEDIETLPSALLEKVTDIGITGEYINRGWLEFDDRGRAYIRNDEEEFIGYLNEGPLTDLSPLAPLTGLQRLNIQWETALTTLDGVQQLQQLEELNINNCDDLSDASAAYTLGGLRFLSVVSTSITDIEGIENLRSLEELYLPWNDFLTDLTPLLDLPNLRTVYISSNMEDAIASLEGQQYEFELVIEGQE